jgi:hypothetical protein
MFSDALEHIINTNCHDMHLCYICMPIIYLFPLSSILSVDPETAVNPEYDYVTDDPSFSAELPGKQTPLIIPISPILSLNFLH